MGDFVGYLADAAKKRASDRPNAIPEDPIAWIESRGGHVWSKQREICAALAKPRARVVVPSSNGTGKTHLAAQLAIHFARKYQNENARVVVVGPSWDQLDEGTLHHARISDAISPPGSLGISRGVFTINDRSMIVWRSPPKGQTARNILQGLHSEKMLVILEESSEIGFRLWNEATIALTSGGDARILSIGNPLDTGTPFHAACEPKSGWHCIPIGTWDTPNFTGEKVPEELENTLPTKEWVNESKLTLSKAEYRARVEGKFPEKSEWALIEPEWVARAMSDTRKPRKNAPAIVSVDPGSGGDPTVTCETKDDVLRFVPMGLLERSRDRAAVAEFIGAVAKRLKSPAIVVDSFGVGGDFGPPLARAAPRARVLMLNTGDRQKLKRYQAREYQDPRAVIGWRFAERLQDGSLVLPEDREFARQILELRQEPTINGLRKLEPKADMKIRLGRSPDLLDAALLSQWVREIHDQVIVGQAGDGI